MLNMLLFRDTLPYIVILPAFVYGVNCFGHYDMHFVGKRFITLTAITSRIHVACDDSIGETFSFGL